MTEWHPLRPHSGLASKEWHILDREAEERGKFVANTSPAKMPTLNHSSSADYKNVYEPSDDTYLLIDALKCDLFSGYPAGDGKVEKGEEDIERISMTASELYKKQVCDVEANHDDSDKLYTGSEKTNGERILEIIKNEGYDEKETKRIALRLRQLQRLERIKTVMEIGTGSGVPITYLSKRLLMEKPQCSAVSKSNSVDNDGETVHENTFSMIATDLNPMALEFAQRTAEENGVLVKDGDNTAKSASIVSMEFVECDLATTLLDRLHEKVDVLLFNPPYVPTEDEEISGSGIEISWAGGKDGRRVIDRALPQIAKLLRKPDGVCYMITVDDNLPSDLAATLRDEHGLGMAPLVRRRAWNEYLSVQKISWL